MTVNTKDELKRLSRKTDQAKGRGIAGTIFDLALLGVAMAIATEIIRWTLLWANAK